MVTGATSTGITEGATPWVAEATKGIDETTGEHPLLGSAATACAGEAGTGAEACLLRVLKADRRGAVETGVPPSAALLLVREATGAEGFGASFSSDEDPASMN